MDGQGGIDGQTARVFDMPHARVTLTPVGLNVEIEVWPKAGQSAYAVVSPNVAFLIARQLAELAVAQLAQMAVTETKPPTGEGADEEASGDHDHERADDESADDEPAGDAPDNIVDLAARRPTRGGGASA